MTTNTSLSHHDTAHSGGGLNHLFQTWLNAIVRAAGYHLGYAFFGVIAVVLAIVGVYLLVKNRRKS